MPIDDRRTRLLPCAHGARDYDEFSRLVSSPCSELEGRGAGTVPASHTARGRAAVMAMIASADQVLSKEAWILPVTPDEASTRLPNAMSEVKKSYETTNVLLWRAFFADVRIVAPISINQAIDLLRFVGTVPGPYGALIDALDEHTRPSDARAPSKPRSEEARFYARIPAPSEALGRELSAITATFDLVPQAFRDAIRFRRADGGKSKLDEYGGIVSRLEKTLADAVAQDASARIETFRSDFERAREEVTKLLSGVDAQSHKMLSGLLLAPLEYATPRSSPL